MVNSASVIHSFISCAVIVVLSLVTLKIQVLGFEDYGSIHSVPSIESSETCWTVFSNDQCLYMGNQENKLLEVQKLEFEKALVDQVQSTIKNKLHSQNARFEKEKVVLVDQIRDIKRDQKVLLLELTRAKSKDAVHYDEHDWRHAEYYDQYGMENVTNVRIFYFSPY